MRRLSIRNVAQADRLANYACQRQFRSAYPLVIRAKGGTERETETETERMGKKKRVREKNGGESVRK